MKQIEQIIADLEGSDNKRVINALFSLRDVSVKHREKAVSAIGRLLAESEDETVQTHCLQSLADIGGKDAVRILQLQMFVASKKNLYLLLQIFHELDFSREATLVYNFLGSKYAGCDPDALKELRRLTGFKPLSLDEMIGLPTPELTDDESPISGAVFEHGGWKILIEQKALGSPEFFTVFFFHSRAKDGPDRLQVQALNRISSIDKSFWKSINEAVIRWIIEQRLDPDSPPKLRKSDWPKVSRFAVPMVKDSLPGCFAIQFESDWELEHGIEVFVLPDSTIKVFQNDNVCTLPDWDKIAMISI